MSDNGALIDEAHTARQCIEVLVKNIYTKTGDGGETSLLSGQRVSKSDCRIGSLGDIDELSVAIGFARILSARRADDLELIQRTLYKLSSAIGYAAKNDRSRFQFEENNTSALEKLIDAIAADLPPLTEFIFPGNAELSCRFHHARVVARRVERHLTELPPSAEKSAAVTYINRLSDLMFMFAREADQMAGNADRTLKPVR